MYRSRVVAPPSLLRRFISGQSMIATRGPKRTSSVIFSSCGSDRTPAHGDNNFKCYSTTAPVFKIHSFGGDKNNKQLSHEEMQKIIDEEEAKMLAEKEAKTYPNWKPGQRKRPLITTRSEEEFERELMPEKFIDNPIWTLRDKRCGALAIKIGMMPVWDEVWGVRHAATVLWLDRNIVLGHKTADRGS